MSFNIQFRRVWAIPILLGALTLFGVLAAFMGSGAWLWASWLALGAPVAVGIRCWVAPGDA